MIRQGFVILLVILAVPLPEAAGQQTSTITSGERVRIQTVDSERLVGRIELVRNDALVLSPESGSRQLDIPFYSIDRLEVRRRASRSQGAWKWAKRGFVIGAISGAVVCGVDVEQCRESPEMREYEIVLGSALFVGGGLAFLGAVGGAIFPGWHWELVSIPNQAHIVPDGRGGFRLSVSWRF